MVIISMKKHSALGEENKNKAGLRFFFPTRARARAQICCVGRCFQRLFEELLQNSTDSPIILLLITSSPHFLSVHPHPLLDIWVEGDCRRRHIPMLHCTMFVYVTDAQDNAGPSSLCTGLISDSPGSNISINQNAPLSPPPPLFFFACKSNLIHPPYERRW